MRRRGDALRRFALLAGIPALLIGGFLLVSSGSWAQDAPQDAPATSAPLTHSALGEYLAGRVARKHDDLGKAADMMSRALAVDPDNPELLQSTYLLLASEPSGCTRPIRQSRPGPSRWR
jgi:hypothetical protein